MYYYMKCLFKFLFFRIHEITLIITLVLYIFIPHVCKLVNLSRMQLHAFHLLIKIYFKIIIILCSCRVEICCSREEGNRKINPWKINAQKINPRK